MAYFKDVREHLSALETAGLLVRIECEVNKDTQLHPLVRLHFRGLPEVDRKRFCLPMSLMSSAVTLICRSPYAI
jgi:hypothetical protein